MIQVSVPIRKAHTCTRACSRAGGTCRCAGTYAHVLVARTSLSLSLSRSLARSPLSLSDSLSMAVYLSLSLSLYLSLSLSRTRSLLPAFPV